MKFRERLQPKGKVELFVTKGKPTVIPGKLISNERSSIKVYESAEIDLEEVELLRQETIFNITLNAGKDEFIQSLATGFIHAIARMAIGDRGAIPSDQTVPKVPVSTMTGLYNEVYRADVDVTTLSIGTPTVHQVQFIKTFNAVDIPITAFSNQSNPIVNEIGLISADLLSGAPLPRAPVAAPAAPATDETVVTLRTFKSVPFDAANDLSITIRYTVFIE